MTIRNGCFNRPSLFTPCHSCGVFVGTYCLDAHQAAPTLADLRERAAALKDSAAKKPHFS